MCEWAKAKVGWILVTRNLAVGQLFLTLFPPVGRSAAWHGMAWHGQVTKTKLDPAWQTVAIRAQELLAGWAETSEQTVSNISCQGTLTENIVFDWVGIFCS